MWRGVAGCGVGSVQGSGDGGLVEHGQIDGFEVDGAEGQMGWEDRGEEGGDVGCYDGVNAFRACRAGD